MSLMIGSGYCLRSTTLFNSLKSLTHRIVLSFFGVTNVGKPHSLAHVSDKTFICTKQLSSFLETARWILGIATKAPYTNPEWSSYIRTLLGTYTPYPWPGWADVFFVRTNFLWVTRPTWSKRALTTGHKNCSLAKTAHRRNFTT